jgi:hypothetical protein
MWVEPKKIIIKRRPTIINENFFKQNENGIK